MKFLYVLILFYNLFKQNILLIEFILQLKNTFNLKIIPGNI